jgi:hypothetical protein
MEFKCFWKSRFWIFETFEDFRNRAFWSFCSKYGFKSKSYLNQILKPRIFFPKRESNDFGKAWTEFWF